MFRRTKDKQGDLFRSITNQVSGRKQKMLGDPVGWHNVFHREVISQIDEAIFSGLYSEGQGRPNSSIRVLVGMLILKEGQGWSDEQLFEECRFNLKVMQALGLVNLDDDVPVEATYYEFKRLLGDHCETTGENLLYKLFEQITIRQVKAHGVRGTTIRLDSKLINSNISKSNRLHLILEGLRSFITDLEADEWSHKIDSDWCQFLKELQKKATTNITYPLNSKEKKNLLSDVGYLIRDLLSIYEQNQPKYYTELKRIYTEQYTEECENTADKDDEDDLNVDDPIELKPASEIESSSLQSIHDPEATYRTKGNGEHKQTVAGYHANITESCSGDDEVRLILDAQVFQANVSEDAFLAASIDQCESILSQASKTDDGIEEVITDGGYDSVTNREEMVKPDRPKWSLSKTKGAQPVYKIDYDENGDLKVWDHKTDEPCEVYFSEKANKYVICSPGRQRRYFTSDQIDKYIQAQQVRGQITMESINLRANVESTIHQVFHRLKKNNKMVYRGLFKCELYVLSRVFWVNIVRITQKVSKDSLFPLKIVLFLLHSFTVNVRQFLAEIDLRLIDRNQLVICRL